MDNNIFDAASRFLRSKKEASAQNKTSKKKPPEEKKSEAEIMIDKMKWMKQDLDKKVENLRELGKKAHVNVDKYLDLANLPKDVNQKDLEKFQKELNDKVAEILPAEMLISEKRKPVTKLTKERKGKLRGAIKKWIPVK